MHSSFSRCHLASGLALVLGLSLPAVAADPAARYEADRKLCAEERDSATRIQCLRDARAEFDKAVAAGGQAGAPTGSCAGCGRVVGVTTAERKGGRTGAGAVAGGVAGGVLGHQIGGGTGRTLATVAGVLGGAYVGDKVEQNVRSTTVWSVRVRLDDGSERTFDLETDPGLREGDPVTVSNGTVARRP